MSDDVDIKNKALIEQIKQAFAENLLKKGYRPLHLVKERSSVPSQRLKETLEGKSWEEAAMDIHIVYNLSDIDHLRDITDEAYLYYLPAFLIGTLLYPDRWIYYSFPLEKISDLLSHFSSKQLDALIAFIDFHVHKLMERA